MTRPVSQSMGSDFPNSCLLLGSTRIGGVRRSDAVNSPISRPIRTGSGLEFFLFFKLIFDLNL